MISFVDFVVSASLVGVLSFVLGLLTRPADRIRSVIPRTSSVPVASSVSEGRSP